MPLPSPASRLASTALPPLVAFVVLIGAANRVSGSDTPDRPPAPTRITAVAQGDTVTVSWEEVATPAFTIEGYDIWRNGEWIGLVDNPTTTWIDDEPPDAAHDEPRHDAQYHDAQYEVRALSGEMRSRWSNPVAVTEPDITPPPAPVGVVARWVDGATARLEWDPVTDPDSGTRHYEIAVGPDTESSGDSSRTSTVTPVVVGTVVAPTTVFVHHDGPGSGRYRIRTVDIAGNVSPWSPPVGPDADS